LTVLSEVYRTVVETNYRSLKVKKEHVQKEYQKTSASEYSGLASRVEERVGGEEKM
jgi:hypothetical protein